MMTQTNTGAAMPAQHETRERDFLDIAHEAAVAARWNVKQNRFIASSEMSDAFIIFCRFGERGIAVEQIRKSRGHSWMVNGCKVTIKDDDVILC